MALRLGALADALESAGASDDVARAAAGEVAAYENRLSGSERQIGELRGQITELRAYVDQRFTHIEDRLNLLPRVVGSSGTALV